MVGVTGDVPAGTTGDTDHMPSRSELQALAQETHARFMAFQFQDPANPTPEETAEYARLLHEATEASNAFMASIRENPSDTPMGLEDDTPIELQEGGVIAEVHPNEAVIPLDTPEGQEALNEAVTQAAGDAIETAVGAVHEAQQIAEDVIAEEVRSAVSEEMRAQFDAYVNELHALTQPPPEPAPEPEPEHEEDTPPDHTHWFFRPLNRSHSG